MPAGKLLEWTVGSDNIHQLPKGSSFEDTEYGHSRFVQEVVPGGNVAAVGVRAGDRLSGEFGFGTENQSVDTWSAAPGTFAIINLERL
jgi:hypothetical protein